MPAMWGATLAAGVPLFSERSRKRRFSERHGTTAGNLPRESLSRGRGIVSLSNTDNCASLCSVHSGNMSTVKMLCGEDETLYSLQFKKLLWVTKHFGPFGNGRAAGCERYI